MALAFGLVGSPWGSPRSGSPSSPELQPAERLWPLTNEPVANQHVADLDALEDVLAARCRTLLAQPQTIHAHTLYHWWPTEEAA